MVVAALTTFLLIGSVVFFVGPGPDFHRLEVGATATVPSAGLPEAEVEASLVERADVDRLMQVVLVVLVLCGVTAGVSLLGLIGSEALASGRRRAVEVMLGAPLARLVGQVSDRWRFRLGAGALLGGVLAPAALALLALAAPPQTALRIGSVAQPSLALLSLLLVIVALLVTPPWLLHRRSDRLGEALRRGGVSEPPARRFRRVILVTFQLAVAVALLSSAGLLRLDQSPGVVQDGQYVAAMLIPSGDSAADISLRPGLYSRALAAMRESPELAPESLATPGAWIDRGPETTALNECGRCMTGLMPHPIHAATVKRHVVMPSFFDSRGLAVLDGRALSNGDDDGGEPVVVINEAYARAHFQDGPAVGRGVALGSVGQDWYRVVGVVEDFPMGGLGGSSTPYSVYFSALQHPPDAVELIARTTPAAPGVGADAEVDLAASGVVAEVLNAGGFADLSLASVRPVSEEIERLYGTSGWLAMGTSGLGWLAGLVALLAVFSVMAAHVRSRLGELGTRAAVGASPRKLRGLVMGEASRIAAVAVGLGLWGAVAIVGVLGPENASIFAPGLFVGVGGAFFVGAILAAVPAALDASTVEPFVALQEIGR
ncbi:MAG: ABC transporter permease [Longimicrobiales bacterium]